MREYIEKDKLLNDIECIDISDCTDIDDIFTEVEKTIDEQPAADVVEVRHARFEWGYQNGQYGIWCTDCGAGWVNSENAEWIAQEHKYCPNCGARMDGDKE